MENKKVSPIIDQNRTIKQIKSATNKFLKVWQRIPPKENFEHEEVKTRINQLPDPLGRDINIRYQTRKSGDRDAPKPDDNVYIITEKQTLTIMRRTIRTEMIIKGFLFNKDELDPRGNMFSQPERMMYEKRGMQT